MRDLPARMDARVGAAGNREPGQLGKPQDDSERRLEVALDRAQARLGSPPGEPRAVVGQVEPDAEQGVGRAQRSSSESVSGNSPSSPTGSLSSSSSRSSGSKMCIAASSALAAPPATPASEAYRS